MNEAWMQGVYLAVIMLCLMVLPFVLLRSPTNFDEIERQYTDDAVKYAAYELSREKQD